MLLPTSRAAAGTNTLYFSRCRPLKSGTPRSIEGWSTRRRLPVPRAFEVFKFGSEEEDRAGEHAANVGIGLDDVVAVGPSSSSPDPSSLVDEDSSIITLFRWPRHIPATSVSIRGSFDGWKSEVPLTRSSDGSDWSTAIPLPCGKVYFKFIVDGRYVTSPSEPVVNDEEGKFNNLRVVHASARFHWPTSLLGGEQVQVDLSDAGFGCGGEDAKLLTMRLVERRLSAFSKTTSKSHELEVCLPPGEYPYAFLVDGVVKTNPGEVSKVNRDNTRVNVKKVPQAPAVRVYYSTGWGNAKLRTRWVGTGENGQELKTPWKEVRLHQTSARGGMADGKSWKYAVVDYIPSEAGMDQSGEASVFHPQELEFYPFDESTRGEDHPSTGGNYRCSFPGGYKLKSGIVRPFNQSIAPPMMLVSDIDGTLVHHEENEATLASTGRFATYWEDRAALTGSFLVFNTGRSYGQVMGLLDHMNGTLPIPDAIITAVGTKIFLLDREKGHRGTTSGSAWQEDVQWARSLDAGWDLEKARGAANEVISELSSDQIAWLDDGSEHPHRVALSVHVNAADLAMHLLREKMEAHGMNFKLIVSGTMEWRYLDCVSGNAGKHAALEHLRSMYGIAVDRCVAAGDSGNDILMLEGDNPAIVVGNAQPALMEWAVRQPQDGRVVVADAGVADGVLEGLARLGLY